VTLRHRLSHPLSPQSWLARRLGKGLRTYGLAMVLGAFAANAEAHGCLDTLGSSKAAPTRDQTLEHALEATRAQRYVESDSLFALPSLAHWPLAHYFSGIAQLQRAEDLGDTAAFHRAHQLWGEMWVRLEKASSHEGDLLRGLVGLQWAATDQHYGRTWHGLGISLKAKSLLQKLPGCPEAQAALALLDYYREQLLPSWSPGGGDPAKAALRLREAAQRCRRMQPLFMTAWIWTQFDLARWPAGLETVDRYLQSYPDHRLYRQMRGDFLFRSGRHAEALDAYRKALNLYPTPATQVAQITGVTQPESASVRPMPTTIAPIGYLSCIGNLARIHAALGQKDSARHYLELWEAPRFKPFDPWLPASLKKALKPLRAQLR
jgi:tetratricopeptide (TPR) repeat protein